MGCTGLFVELSSKIALEVDTRLHIHVIRSKAWTTLVHSVLGLAYLYIPISCPR